MLLSVTFYTISFYTCVSYLVYYYFYLFLFIYLCIYLSFVRISWLNVRRTYRKAIITREYYFFEYERMWSIAQSTMHAPSITVIQILKRTTTIMRFKSFLRDIIRLECSLRIKFFYKIDNNGCIIAFEPVFTFDFDFHQFIIITNKCLNEWFYFDFPRFSLSYDSLNFIHSIEFNFIIIWKINKCKFLYTRYKNFRKIQRKISRRSTNKFYVHRNLETNAREVDLSVDEERRKIYYRKKKKEKKKT